MPSPVVTREDGVQVFTRPDGQEVLLVEREAASTDCRVLIDWDGQCEFIGYHYDCEGQCEEVSVYASLAELELLVAEARAHITACHQQPVSE